MNPNRMQAVMDGLTSQAAKVFEAVPIRDQWDVRQIMQELARHGRHYDMNRVMGCLGSLVESGLIRQYRGGTFKRVDVAKRPALSTVREIAPVTILHPKKAEPMDELARIASQMREQAASLNAEAEKLEAAALEMQQQIEAAKGENGKLAQLRNLLKDI